MATPTITVEQAAPNIAVLSLHGEHDLGTAGELRDKIRAAYAEDVRLVVDLTPTLFLDSTIIAALFEALRDAAGRSGETFALVVRAGSAVERTLNMVGFPMLLNRLYGSREEVLAAWEG